MTLTSLIIFLIFLVILGYFLDAFLPVLIIGIIAYYFLGL